MAGGKQPATRDLRLGSREEDSPSVQGVDGAGRRRRRRFRLPWWLDLGFEVSKPTLVVGALMVAVIMLGLLGARLVWQNSGGAAGTAAAVADGASIYDGPKSPNYGQPMSAAMKLRLARYGIPLHIGPRGLPLIEERITGLVREATELEMTFPETAQTVRSGLNPERVSQPGPEGGPVHRLQPDVAENMREPVAVDRIAWFVEQEDRISAVLRDVTLGVAHITGTDYRRWDDDWGVALAAITDMMTDKYAWGDRRLWPLAGSMNYCDPALERVAEGGVTEGCPSEELQRTATAVWTIAGHIVESMSLMGKAAQLPYDHQVGGYYREAAVVEYQQRNLRRIESGMTKLQALVDAFRRQGSEEGFYVHIWVP